MTIITICDGCAKPIDTPGRVNLDVPRDGRPGFDYLHFHDAGCLRRYLGGDWPKPGVWLLEEVPGGYRRGWTQIGLVPDPMTRAAVERYRARMVVAVADLLAEHSGAPDEGAIVDAVMGVIEAEDGV